MLEALFHLLVEVLLYGKGYWTLRLFSGGRIRPGCWNDGLVSLVGLLATLLWAIPVVIWLSGD